jgi:predicted TIM-barrel fold metal-dependent hydrolase
MAPSDYYHRNVAIGASCVPRADLDLREAIGTGQIMWGSDYPHPEGTWPNTGEYLKTTFSNFPEEDGRRILGDNAVEFYGLDREKLQAVADQIGPDASIFA